MDEWISVEAALPEDHGHYLAVCTWNEMRWVTTLLWDGYRFHVKQATSAVTHWQPLPELPLPSGPPKPDAFAMRGLDVSPERWGVYHIDSGWPVRSFASGWSAVGLCATLNRLWALDKGSNDE